MDYEFRRDPFGGYRARFSMGHEAIGQWLIDEVGKDEEKALFMILNDHEIIAKVTGNPLEMRAFV